MDVMKLKGALVSLRPWRQDEAEWYVAARDNEVLRWTTEPRELGVEEARANIASSTSQPGVAGFAIAGVDRDELLGNLAVRIVGATAVVSYWLAAEGRGRGVATEALVLAADWILGTGLAPGIEQEIHPANAASRRVAEKAGFHDVGMRRSCETCADEQGQVVVYRRQAPTTSEDPKRVVAEGYDEVWERYERWATDDGDARRFYIDLALEMCSDATRALDLGCGTGLRATAYLAHRLVVTGIDISAASIDVARRRLPGTEFLVADMAAVEFPARSFDVVFAFYSLIHVPRREHRAVIGRVARWLRPGGVFVATMGAGDGGEGYEDDWLGARMFWSNWDAGTNQGILEEAGLEVVRADERVTVEDGRPIGFLWVVGRRP